MSERTRDPAPSVDAIVRGNETTHRYGEPPRPLHYGGQSSNVTSGVSAPALHRQPSGNARSMELPPLPQAPGFTSKAAGVSSMLNPTETDDHSTIRRRKIPQIEGSDSPKPILPPLQGSNRPYQTSSGAPSPIPAALSGPRRMLTPRSPSIQRTASLNQLNQPKSMYGSQQSSFHPSPRTRSYAIEPGASGVPPLPAVSAGARQQYGYSGPTPTSEPSRRASSGAGRGMRRISESTSPRSSYSGYSHAEQSSPTGQYAPSMMPTLSSAYSADHPSTGPDGQRHMGVPITSSTGQNVYQMMTLETTSGTVQLPVDIQAASRVADEKRRRNAGASARFRQRRKEKEREASTTISRLEQQIKDISEDADFYKRERDYLAGVVLQVPGGDRHFPRPQSPRHRRRSSMAGPSTGGANYISMHDQGRHSPDEGRNVRRRTSTMSLPPPPQAQAQAPMSTPAAPFQQTYLPPAFGHLAPQTQQGPHTPPGHGLPPPPLNRSVSLTSHPQLMQAPPQTGPYNPFSDRRHLSAQGPSSR